MRSEEVLTFVFLTFKGCLVSVFIKTLKLQKPRDQTEVFPVTIHEATVLGGL